MLGFLYMPDGVNPFVQLLVSCWGKCTFISRLCPQVSKLSEFMEKASNHFLPFQIEIIDIDSSDSGSDIEVEADEPFDGSFSDSTTYQSRNASERFTDQNHDMQLQNQRHHGNGSASYAAIQHRPFTGTSGENSGNTIEEHGRDETSLFSSGEAIHASKPKDHEIQNRSNGNIDANLELYEEIIRDPERQILTDMLPQANLESGSVAIRQNTDARSSQNSKRTLPPSLQLLKSGSVSPFHSRFHGKALLSPQKNPMQAQKSKRPQAGPDDDADNNRLIGANLNQYVHKQNHLPYVHMKNASTRLADERRSSQRHEPAHGSVEANVSSSKFGVEDVSEMNGENHIYQKERRALPNHWIGKTSNNSQPNASMHSSISGQNSNFSTKPSHPVSSKAHNSHMFPDVSLRNEKFITSSKGLYEGIDDVFMYENASATRILPQYPGKSSSNPRLAGSSDGGQFPGIGEQRLEHDETLIYQEALQNLGQPKLEDDLPEGLLTVSLLKHQKVALAWMVQKERSVHCAGGILADDQGLGKTIAMIALILKQRDLQLKFTSDDSHHVKSEALNLDDDEGNNEMDVTGIRKGDHVKSETLNLDDDGVINEMDVKGIGKNYLQSKLTNTSENRRPAAGTLVVCPASILRQWAHELEEKVSSCTNLSVLVYHGGTRTKDPKDLAKHDVILTTYSIVTNEIPKQPLVDDDDDNEQKDMEKYGLSSDFAASKKRKQTSNAGKKGKKKVKGRRDSHVDYGGPLARVRWFRVILDEAQTIKNHRTQVARACSALRAKRRWCLSGTPIQNAIDDLYSYFRFLKYDPYAVYSSFCNSIKYPISRNASQGYKKLQAVLRVVLLRRTKATLINGEPIIKLPPKSISLKNVDFSPEERAFYMKLEADSRQQFKVYAAAGTVKQNYANILLMLLRLRQACDHPILVKGYYSESNARDSLEMARQLPKEMLLNLVYRLEALSICPVCNDTPEDPVVTMCGHVFCYQCVSDRLTGDDNLCPATGCKDILGPDSVFSQATLKRCIFYDLDVNAASSSSVHSEESSIVQSGFVSSKISAAVDILNSLSSQSYHAGETENSEDSWCSDKPVKAIVFSQWTGMLDLVEISLNRSLIQYRRLDGTMSLSSRDRSVREFNTDPEVTVMLMSLKAGNLGLNMVAACHVILLDLWWNPTTEDQAIDRAHRIGQTRPVTVSRLTIKDTVEDRILALQEEKRKMVSSAFGEDHAGNHTTRLTVDDLKYLFMI